MTKMEAGKYREITENYTVIITDTKQFKMYDSNDWEVKIINNETKEVVETTSRPSLSTAKSAAKLSLFFLGRK